MPFYIQAKNTKTNEIRSFEAPHAHGNDDPEHPEYHNRAHVDDLNQARLRSKVFAKNLNEESDRKSVV